MIRSCEVCQKEFYTKEYFFIRGQGRFCSTKCHGQSKKGIIPPNLKYAQSKSPITKKGDKHRAYGENHPGWQKENPSYRAIHAWLRDHFGKANKCENPKCVYPRKSARGYWLMKPNKFQWANISREYKRDRNDFMQLCSSCHKKYDIAYSRQNALR